MGRHGPENGGKLRPISIPDLGGIEATDCPNVTEWRAVDDTPRDASPSARSRPARYSQYRPPAASNDGLSANSRRHRSPRCILSFTTDIRYFTAFWGLHFQFISRYFSVFVFLTFFILLVNNDNDEDDDADDETERITFTRRDFKGGVAFGAFGIARNFCSGLALTVIIYCYWPRGETS